MATTIVHLTLEPITCSECGTTFGLPTRLYEQRRDDHKTFWCPNGCTQHFPGKSRSERLQEQLRWAREDLARRNSELDQTKALLNGQRSRASRFKNERDRDRARIAAGVCPCCNRSFANLAAHMAGQHPEYSAPEEA